MSTINLPLGSILQVIAYLCDYLYTCIRLKTIHAKPCKTYANSTSETSSSTLKLYQCSQIHHLCQSEHVEGIFNARKSDNLPKEYRPE